MKNIKTYVMMIAMVAACGFMAACGDDDAPEEENVVEVITDVTLVFTNTADASDVVRASAQDPDGAGAQELVVQDEITLTAGATYTLTYEIQNALDPNDVEDIGEEISEEDDEHQLFYAFSTDAFTSPAGDGNIDTASDPVNYNDTDGNGCNLGLNTTWTAGQALQGGTFRVQLQHQPDVKTCTTGATVGDTDFNLTFTLNIQ